MIDTTSRRRFLQTGTGALGVWALAGHAPLLADETPESMAAKAVGFLRGRQDASGAWSVEREEPGITALVVTAMLRTKQVTPADPSVVKGLAYLQQYVDAEKGGLAKSPHANYATAIALMAFQSANADGRHDAFIKSSQGFLKAQQWDESEGKGRDSDFYGGAGYGGSNSRPDLSNTAFMLEALRDSGLPADDPALQRALVFVSRCQNLKGEFNDQPWASKINDGGFIYTAANGGQSMAGGNPKEGLPSYAGMTYAGLKSMIHAGLKPDDPRVKAAVGYIKSHYNVEENPGMGETGLYYYYQTFSKALALLGEPTVVDASGKPHDWRADLVGALGRRQAANGSWVNPKDRFMEGDPNLVTAYALLALAYTRGK